MSKVGAKGAARAAPILVWLYKVTEPRPSVVVVGHILVTYLYRVAPNGGEQSYVARGRDELDTYRQFQEHLRKLGCELAEKEQVLDQKKGMGPSDRSATPRRTGEH